MGKFGIDDDEEDVLAPKEPQVTSLDPDERKAARALRIKKRHDALKRAEQPSEEIISEEPPGLIEQATAVAAEDNQRLALDGAAKVTNVKVTTDEREVIRRALFAKNMKSSFEKIEAEAIEAQSQYEEIFSEWEVMLQIRDPLDIDAAMKEQKQRCDALLEQKDNLIDHVKNDLKNMDDAYYEDLEKQDRDIKELSERIEKQITIMQRAYEKQLFLIEQAINMERDAMLDHNNKRWEALYRQRDREEVAHMEQKFEQLEDNKTDMELIMWDHYEKYRQAKIELETLIQDLQRELEKLKAVCIINSEKIGYNFQVLKKREEENVFVRSQQKRKLNKMSDVANALRAKIRKADADGIAEEIKADIEIKKLIEAMGDLEKKSEHFSQVNNYKYNQVWRMSAAKCAELVRDIRDAEVVLHAHVLAEPPPPPPPRAPINPLKSQTDLEKPSTNQEISKRNIGNKAATSAKERLVRHIFQLISDNSGFLVEDRLLKLIEKYQKCSRNLCTVDSIFLALEIGAEDDIELLCQTFLPYAFCPTCIDIEVSSDENDPALSQDSNYANMSVTDRAKLPKGRCSVVGRASVVGRSISASTSRSAHVAFRGAEELSPSDHILLHEANEIVQKCGDPQVGVVAINTGSDSSSSQAVRRSTRGVTVSSQPQLAEQQGINTFLCPAGHDLEIEPMQVLQSLVEFVSVFMPPEKQKLYEILDSVKPRDFTTPSRILKTEEVEQYWAEWKKMYPKEKDTFWDGLITGLNNYLNVLQERERLYDEVLQLRKKNTALRRMMRGALPEVASAALPNYARSYPPAFTAAAPDYATSLETRLPPI